MSGPVVAGGLPPLLPTPTAARTTCISLRPRPAPYASKKPAAMTGPVVAGSLPPLMPTPTTTSCVSLRPPPASYMSQQSEGSRKQAGRASLSQSWIKDKLGGGCSGASADTREKMPGRASLSSSWVEDKMVGRASTSSSGVERASRPTWRDGWNGSKRAASRAPSADRFEKKAKPLAEEDDDVLESEAQQYAGPTFVLSPDPSELPIPFFFLKLKAQ